MTLAYFENYERVKFCSSGVKFLQYGFIKHLFKFDRKIVSWAQCYKTFSVRNLQNFKIS